MKITEKILEPAEFLKKEFRHVLFQDVSKHDFPELLLCLYNLFNHPRRKKCKLWALVGGMNYEFNTQEELNKFMEGFAAAIELHDPEIRQKMNDFHTNNFLNTDFYI